MSLKSLSPIFRVLIACLVLLCLAGSFSAEDKIRLEWSFKAGEDVLMLSAGDVNNDNASEIVAVSSRQVYVLNSKGALAKAYPINFTASAVHVADIDNDGAAEILLGSGFQNTSDVRGPRFDFNKTPDIKEKEEYLYRVLRSQGDVYVIQENSSGPVKWLPVNDWVRGIFTDDIDGDGSNEIFVASGGVNIDYIEKVHIETNPKTGNLTYVRNRTELSANNGSLKVFLSNGTLRNNYRTTDTVWSVSSASFREGEGRKILAGSKKIIILDKNATEISTINPSDLNNSIMDIIPDDVNKDREKEIVASFVGPVISGVYLLNDSGAVLWEYRINSKNVNGLFSVNLDIDGAQEVVAASDKTLYVLSSEGMLKWSQPLEPAIGAFHVSDFGDNAYMDFIMSSGGEVRAYEIDERFYKSQLAQRYYLAAKENYDSARYEAAVVNLTSARNLYSEISDPAGLSRCDSLLGKINEDIKKTMEENANSLYAKGRNEYFFGKYDEAREYYLKAREVYSQIGDVEGVSKCDAAIKEIETDMLKSTTTPTAANPAVTDTSNNAPEEKGTSLMTIMILAVLVLILIVFGLMMAKGLMKKEENKK